MAQKFNLNYTLKRLQKYEWYRQGAAVKHFYVGYPWRACLEFTLKGKRIPFYYQDVLVYFEGDYFTVFFRKDVLKKVANFYYLKQKKDSKFIFKLYRNWLRKYVKPYKRVLLRLEKIDFKIWDNKKLLKEFSTFSETYTKMWREAIFLDSFDFYGDYILEKEIEESKIELSSTDFQTLIVAENPSWIQKEQIDLAKLLKRFTKQQKLKTAILKGKGQKTIKLISKSFYQALEKHVQKYHWLHNDYAVIVNLLPRYF